MKKRGERREEERDITDLTDLTDLTDIMTLIVCELLAYKVGMRIHIYVYMCIGAHSHTSPVVELGKD